MCRDNVRQFAAFLRTCIVPLLSLSITLGCGVALLFAAYRAPLPLHQEFSAPESPITGLYPPEHNAEFSYAYSRGITAWSMPNIDAGPFVVSFRAASPGASVPLGLAVQTNGSPVNIGTVQQLRVYHVLEVANADGDFAVRLISERTPLASHGRVGVLLDWLDVQPLHAPNVPVPVLSSAMCTLALLWITVSQLRLAPLWQWAALLSGAALLAALHGVARGHGVVQPWLAGGIGSAALLACVLGRGAQVQHYPFRRVLTVALLWRAALALIGFVAIRYNYMLLPIGDHISKENPGPSRFESTFYALFGSWLQWDGGHYSHIIQTGYTNLGQYPNIAFYPLYPLLTYVVSLATHNIPSAGLIVSFSALLVALYFLYDLLRADFGPWVAYATCTFVLLFPTSVFFIAVLTEALAFALLVIAVWAMQRQRWWVAGVAGALLALTRLPGIFVAPLLVFAYMQHARWNWRAIRANVLAALLPPLGLLLFMGWQWYRFGDPLASFHAQQAWDMRLGPPWQAFTMWLASHADTAWPMLIVQLVTYLLFVVLIVLALQKLPTIYGLAALLMLLPSYLVIRIYSFPRYVLMGFLALTVVGVYAEGRPWLYRGIVGVCVPLLVLFTMLFVNGFWMG